MPEMTIARANRMFGKIHIAQEESDRGLCGRFGETWKDQFLPQVFENDGEVEWNIARTCNTCKKKFDARTK